MPIHGQIADDIGWVANASPVLDIDPFQQARWDSEKGSMVCDTTINAALTTMGLFNRHSQV